MKLGYLCYCETGQVLFLKEVPSRPEIYVRVIQIAYAEITTL